MSGCNHIQAIFISGFFAECQELADRDTRQRPFDDPTWKLNPGRFAELTFLPGKPRFEVSLSFFREGHDVPAPNTGQIGPRGPRCLYLDEELLPIACHPAATRAVYTVR